MKTGRHLDVAHGMLDLTSLVLNTLTPQQLLSYVLRGDGGDAEAWLRTILEDGSVFRYAPAETGNIPELLEKYGPGLVANFKVEPSFSNTSRTHFHGPCGFSTSSLLEFDGHAMVLVGEFTMVVLRVESCLTCASQGVAWVTTAQCTISCKILGSTSNLLKFANTTLTAVGGSFSSSKRCKPIQLCHQLSKFPQNTSQYRLCK